MAKTGEFFYVHSRVYTDIFKNKPYTVPQREQVYTTPILKLSENPNLCLAWPQNGDCYMGRFTEDQLLATAKGIAELAHDGQVDKAGRPYIEHPLAVAAMLDSATEKTVALLHDVLEDSDKFQVHDLYEAGFSDDIINAVLALTRRNGETRANYIKRVKQNPLATKVKLADLTHNMDLSRIPSPTRKDIERTKMYQKNFDYLRKSE